MELKTKEFQDVAKTILMAANVDKRAANLKLEVKEENLFLSVTDREYFCSIRFPLEEHEPLLAVVDANLFLNLIAKLTTETFSLELSGNSVVVKSGKSSYRLPMIYENDKLIELPAIQIFNKTVEMPISNNILKSILNVNSRELQKETKTSSISELQRLYYVDENGCFTFTTGACLNAFKLDKPVKLLLTDKVVRLFKLFSEDVYFSYGYDALPNGANQAKATFETDNIYVAALVSSDDLLLSRVQGPCNATKNMIDMKYSNHIVVSAIDLLAAVERLLLFAKHYNVDDNRGYLPATVSFSQGEITLSDMAKNIESVQIENDSYVDESYSMVINLLDLKLVLESCKNDHVTINCGNHKSVVITRGVISNIIPESRKSA